MLIDKQIHKNEFRLRILMTNLCNKNCSYCLNDFQPKDEGLFLDYSILKIVVSNYVKLMNEKNEKPIITFSGGEPGENVYFPDSLIYAKKKGAEVKVCTNGSSLYRTLDKYVDKWHISITDDLFLPYWLSKEKVVLQYVVCDNTTIETLREITEKYYFKIKFFVDFFSNQKDKLYEKINIINNEYSIESRYTGVQENRGIACLNCSKECVTLKAAWLLADGRITTCPQRCKDMIKPNKKNCLEIMNRFYMEHNTYE